MTSANCKSTKLFKQTQSQFYQMWSSIFVQDHVPVNPRSSANCQICQNHFRPLQRIFKCRKGQIRTRRSIIAILDKMCQFVRKKTEPTKPLRHNKLPSSRVEYQDRVSAANRLERKENKNKAKTNKNLLNESFRFVQLRARVVAIGTNPRSTIVTMIEQYIGEIQHTRNSQSFWGSIKRRNTIFCFL